MTGVPDHDGPVREQLSALRSMLVLAMLLTQQDSQDSILHYVANAVESLGSCTTEGIFLDGLWQDVRIAGRKATSLPAVINAADGGPVTLADVPWSWAYSLSSRHGPAGYLVVGAPAPPAESERFLLQVLAQQAGVALANARLHSREREQAGELRVANLALVRSMEIHDRLTKVALEGEGQAGIAQAVYELTDRPAAIEDRFGNLLAWAGPDRPDPYPKADPAQAGPAAGPGHERRGPGPGGPGRGRSGYRWLKPPDSSRVIDTVTGWRVKCSMDFSMSSRRSPARSRLTPWRTRIRWTEMSETDPVSG